PETVGEARVGEEVRLGGPAAHQLTNVLRLRPGERISLLDGAGWEYEVELSALERSAVRGVIVRRALAGGEPRLKVTIYQGLTRANRFEWVLQTGTELGVSAFVP